MSSKRELNLDFAVVLRNLQVAESSRDLRSTRSCIFEVLHLSNNGCNVSSALPTVVKLLAHNDVFIKRVAGELMAAYAECSPEMVLLAVNTLVHDCRDLNPVIRSLSLKTLSCLAKSLPSVDVLNTAVSQCLEDRSPAVKQTAALSCVGLHQLAPDSVTEGGIWDRLYQHLSDPEPGTVAGCMCALESIFAQEKGLVVSNKLGQYLISTMTTYTPAVQRLVLQFLLKLSPKKKSQVFEHLNDLDDYLSRSSSIATVLCALELFCHLSSDLPKVREKAFVTAWESLKVNLARERNEEVIASLLDYLNSTDFPTKVMVQDYKLFYCRDDDALFLIKKKSCLLSKIITPDNAENIFKEFLSIVKCLDSVSLSQVLLNISSHIGGKSEVEGMLVQFLHQLFELDNTTVTETVIQILPTLGLSDESNWATMASYIQKCYRQIRSTETQIALLGLLQVHSSYFDKAPEILENMMHVIKEEAEEHTASQYGHNSQEMYSNNGASLLLRLKLGLLCAMVHVGLKKPAKVQQMLSQFMESCIRDENRLIRDRALFLYGFLYSKVKQELSAQVE